MLSIVKLEEALKLEPESPNVHYGLGLTFEALGIYDKAGDHFLEVFRQGALKAGSLWQKASLKLESGFVHKAEGLASLGVVRTLEAQKTKSGTQHGIILPIQIAPGNSFDPSLLQTKVHFYEKSGGEVVKAQTSTTGSTWLTEPLDWRDGEEVVKVWYEIPAPDLQQSLLYGDRTYYGYVAELFYDGDLVDMRVFPRVIGSLIENSKNTDTPLFDDFDPNDEFDFPTYEPGDPLLPPLPRY